MNDLDDVVRHLKDIDKTLEGLCSDIQELRREFNSFRPGSFASKLLDALREIRDK